MNSNDLQEDHVDPSIVDSLLHKVETTARCRFAGNRRLTTNIQHATILIAWYSAFTIFVATLSASGRDFLGHPTLTAALLILASVIILVASLIFTSAGKTEIAVNMHHCGKELNALALEIKGHCRNGKIHLTHDKYEELRSHYEATLQGLQNHHPSDYLEQSRQEQLRMKVELPFIQSIKTEGRLIFEYRTLYLSKIWRTLILVTLYILPVGLLTVLLIQEFRLT